MSSEFKWSLMGTYYVVSVPGFRGQVTVLDRYVSQGMTSYGRVTGPHNRYLVRVLPGLYRDVCEEELSKEEPG